MKELRELRDDEIRVVGSDRPRRRKHRTALLAAAIVAAVAIIAAAIVMAARGRQHGEVAAQPAPPTGTTAAPVDTARHIGREVEARTAGFTELIDTAINDVPLRLYIPHNASMTLHVGRLDKSDSTIVFAAQAADIRADNGGIVGAFVLAGEPLSWGLSKKGYCAVIGDTVTIGTADNSPLFERATETGGYFFRQYPLVSNGRLVENNPKGKSIRRAICDRQGEILMVGTLDTESFHDFSQALVDLGVDQAIYLVGASSYGWAVDGSGTRHEFGNENIHTSGRHKMSDNTSYIVWRRK